VQATPPMLERSVATLEALVARPTTPHHGYALNMLGLIHWLRGMAFENWARLLTTQGLYAEARKLRERALGCSASTPGPLMVRANVLCARHRDKQGYAEVRRALKRHPDSIPLLTAAGLSLVRLRRPHEAIPLLERVRASGHRGAFFYPALVLAYIATGDAATALSRANERPHWGMTDVYRQRTLVKALVAAGLHDEALAAYDAAKNSSFDAETMTGRADALCALGRHDQAIAVYREALVADPHCAEAHSGWGRALAAQRRHEEALGKFAEAARVDPSYADAFREWSRSLAALGRNGESDKKLRHAEALEHRSREPSPVR
jgi:tetratricopeptide (TPR) repeat protein